MPHQVDTVLDETEFSILTTIERSQTPLWKKEIHRRILDNTDRIPKIESVSIQTISRRVQTLYDNHLLKAKLTNTDKVNRTLITTYDLTDKGKTALNTFRENFLQEWVVNSLHTHLSETIQQSDTNPKAIKYLFCDHYDIPRHTCQDIALEHILKVLTDTFLTTKLDRIVDKESHNAFTATLKQHDPDLAIEDNT